MWKNGERVLGRSNKWLVVVLLFLVGTWTNAAPTVNDSGSGLVARDISPSSDGHIRFVSETSQITQSPNSQLADIAAEFAKPSIPFADSEASLPTRVKPLPPIPAAFLMTLTGFLCVSLVKDRRVWLAAAAGLIYIGQIGINAVPKLVPHIHSKQQIKQLSSPKATYVCELENSFRLRCDVEGTRYIGLLHRLAGIPDDENAIANQGGRISALSRAYKALLSRQYGYAPANPVTFTPTIIQRLYNLILSPRCLAPRAEQPVCFSPAFIFERLPHGPPKLA